MNRAYMIGNLTKAPELRTTGGGKSVCTFSIAVSRKWKGRDGTQQTDFFNIVVWGALAETCSRYLDKGNKVAISGEIQTRSYDDKNGVKKYVTEIIADEVEFLTPKNKPQESNPQDWQEIGDDLPFH